MQNLSCCRISVFDPAANKQLTSFLGGSKGKRVGQGLGAAAMSIASFEAGRSSAGPGGTFMYSIYTPTVRGAARGPVVFGPGEKKAYAVDTQTNDVTVVDVDSGQRIANVDGGNGLSAVISLPDAGLIAAVSLERIDFIDTTNDTVRDTIKGSMDEARVTPDGKRLVIFGKERIIIIDTKTGKQLGVITDLKSPSRLIFLK
jgi:DNA-binding beta-propeller fold protein YncE